MAFISDQTNGTLFMKTTYIFCILLTISLLFISYGFISLTPPFYFTSSLSTKFNPVNHRNKYNNANLLWSVDSLLLNLTFSLNKAYHHNGVAYDYHSKNELGSTQADHRWKVWPLPNEKAQNSSTEDIEISPFRTSKGPFIDAIYAVSAPHLTERHASLKRAFHQQGISMELLKWKMKWTFAACNSNLSHSDIHQRLNLKHKPLTHDQKRFCSSTMNHVDIWYEIAKQRISLALILEDDVIFVPFFKEKFTRMIYAALDNSVLRLNQTCAEPNEKPISNDEWVYQKPMIVIGTCGLVSEQSLSVFSSPSLSIDKSQAARCSHAYLLTSCSAQSLIDQIHAQKNDLMPADMLQNYLVFSSPVLQAFWMEPPIVYQGNKVIDLDNLETFKRTTHHEIYKTVNSIE